MQGLLLNDLTTLLYQGFERLQGAQNFKQSFSYFSYSPVKLFDLSAKIPLTNHAKK